MGVLLERDDEVCSWQFAVSSWQITGRSKKFAVISYQFADNTGHGVRLDKWALGGMLSGSYKANSLILIVNAGVRLDILTF